MGHVAAAFDQAGYRHRDDDGNEATATYSAALNTPITLETATVARCRVILEETAGGGENNVSTQWQVQLNGGGWNNVTTASAIVRAVTSTQGSLDGVATTRQISTGTFVSAEVTEDGLSDAVRPSFTGNEVTELELVFEIVDADVADTDTIELRVVRADGTLFTAYTQTPSLTVSKTAGGAQTIPVTNTVETEAAQAVSPSVPADFTLAFGQNDELTITDFANLAAPGGEWYNNHQRPTWWNGFQSRWDGVLPIAIAAGAAAQSDWHFVTDIAGTPVVGDLVRSDRFSRPDIFWDETAKILYVLMSHNTAARLYRFDYNDGTDTYTVRGAPITVPGVEGQKKPVMTKAPDGSIWVSGASHNTLEILVNKSTDDGDTWAASAVAVKTVEAQGDTHLVTFDPGGGVQVGVAMSEDDTAASPNVHFVHIGQGDAGWETPANWTDETASLPALSGTAVSDDELSATTHDNIVYITFETGSGGTGDDQLVVFKRATDGTWTKHTIHTLEAGTVWKRPNIVIDSEAGKAVVFATDPNNDETAMFRADIPGLGSWSGPDLVFSGVDHYNPHSPRGPTDATSDLLLLGENITASQVMRQVIQTEPSSSAQTEPVVAVTETEVAQGVTAATTITVGVANAVETEAAEVVGVGSVVSVVAGAVTEIEAGQAVGTQSALSVAIASSTETEAVQVVGSLVTRSVVVGASTESEIGQTIDPEVVPEGWVFVGFTTDVAGNGTPLVLPAGAQAGDLAVVVAGFADTPTTPSWPGYVRREQRLAGGNSMSIHDRLLDETAADEPNLSTSTPTSVCAMVFRPVDEADRFDVSTAAYTPSATNHSHPGVTTTTGDTLLVLCHTNDNNNTYSNWGVANSSGMTEVTETLVSSVIRTGIAWGELPVTGPSGNASWTLSPGGRDGVYILAAYNLAEASQSKAVNPATEIEVAQTVSPVQTSAPQTVSVATVTESESAQPITVAVSIAVINAIETETPEPVSPYHIWHNDFDHGTPETDITIANSGGGGTAFDFVTSGNDAVPQYATLAYSGVGGVLVGHEDFESILRYMIPATQEVFGRVILGSRHPDNRAGFRVRTSTGEVYEAVVNSGPGFIAIRGDAGQSAGSVLIPNATQVRIEARFMCSSAPATADGSIEIRLWLSPASDGAPDDTVTLSGVVVEPDIVDLDLFTPFNDFGQWFIDDLEWNTNTWAGPSERSSIRVNPGWWRLGRFETEVEPLNFFQNVDPVPGTVTITVDEAVEIEAGQPVDPVQTGAPQTEPVAAVLETEATQTVSVQTQATIAVTQAVESEVGQSVGIALGVVFAPETEEGRLVAPVQAGAPQSRPVDSAIETETGEPITGLVAQTIVVTEAVESETVEPVPLEADISIPVDPVSEVEAVQAVGILAGALTVAVNFATESEQTNPVTVAAVFVAALNAALETETVQIITFFLGAASISVGAVTEVEAGQAIVADDGIVGVPGGLRTPRLRRRRSEFSTRNPRFTTRKITPL